MIATTVRIDRKMLLSHGQKELKMSFQYLTDRLMLTAFDREYPKTRKYVNLLPRGLAPFFLFFPEMV